MSTSKGLYVALMEVFAYKMDIRPSFYAQYANDVLDTGKFALVKVLELSVLDTKSVALLDLCTKLRWLEVDKVVDANAVASRLTASPTPDKFEFLKSIELRRFDMGAASILPLFPNLRRLDTGNIVDARALTHVMVLEKLEYLSMELFLDPTEVAAEVARVRLPKWEELWYCGSPQPRLLNQFPDGMPKLEDFDCGFEEDYSDDYQGWREADELSAEFGRLITGYKSDRTAIAASTCSAIGSLFIRRFSSS